jgi:hypothetical protein
MHLEGKGRNEIAESMKEYASSGTISNVISNYRNTFNKSDRVTTFTEVLGEAEFKKKKPYISIENHAIVNTRDFEENGHPFEDSQGQGQGQGQKGGPLSWFTKGRDGYGSEIKSETSQFATPVLTDLPTINSELPSIARMATESTVVNVNKHPTISKSQDVPKPETSKPKIREPVTSVEKSIYKKLEQERVAWDYYGAAWMRILNQIEKEKGQRRHELFLIDCRKRKLEEWRKRLEQMQYDLTAREGRILESEPYLSLAKKLQEMKLTLEDALPWIETINEVAQIQNTDINHAAIFVAQELRLNRQLGGMQRQIEKANQELALINMTTIQKQEALTILMDLMNRGVTESQIIQLINFASEWNKYWKSSTNGNLQRPVATKW